MRLAPVLVALALAACCGGCESTQEESANLERAAKHERLALQGTSVSRQSPDVQVLAVEVVHGRRASAVVVHLRDTSSRPIVGAPIAIAARDAAGEVVYQNNAPGEDPSLTRVSLQPGQDAIWIDDQVHSEAAKSASAKVGAGRDQSGPAPKLSVEGLRAGGEGSEASAEGSVKNLSGTTQLNLVVFVWTVRAGKTIAAGRALLPEVLAGANDSFQAFFVGDPNGARLHASVLAGS